MTATGQSVPDDHIVATGHELAHLAARAELQPDAVERTWTVTIADICKAVGIPFQGGGHDGTWKLDPLGENAVQITNKQLRSGR